jgi:ankyrin repeat protein
MTEISAAMNALYHGDTEKGEQLLSDQPSIFEAAAFGRVDDLKRIVAADPQAAQSRAPDDFTPLHLAAFFGQAEAVRILLEAGADVNAEASNSFVSRVQPLHSAAANRDRDCCRLLVEAGADINAQQADGFTPLMEAAQEGDVELAEMFLAAGADDSIQRDDGTEAASLAEQGGHQAVIDLLKNRKTG